MFKTLLSMSVLGIFLLGLSACSDVQVTTFPTGNNSYRLIATSSSQGDAMKGAENKAQQICLEKHKQLKVVSVKTAYQGAFDKQTAKTVDIATGALTAATGVFMPGSKSSNDYVTRMVFRCL